MRNVEAIRKLKHSSMILLLCLSTLPGCTLRDRLAGVGKTPDFNAVKVYEDARHEANPKPKVEAEISHPNSLWRAGSRSFFRDQRARAVGDILKVVVNIQDSAKMDNKTDMNRSSNSSLSAPSMFGLEKEVEKILPDSFNPSKMVSLQSKDSGGGTGKIDRKETVTTTVAAMVTQILPSNNLVIRGSQEVRVNYELREITIEGVVRPEDISAENSVTLEQIAEARVSYGGRGNLSDRQQERYGKQVLDIVSPF